MDCKLKVTKCTFVQSNVAFLEHIVGRTGIACHPVKFSAVLDWHAPGLVKHVHQFVGFVGYYCHFIQNFEELSEPLVTLARKGAVFAWTPERQEAICEIEVLPAPCPDIGFPYRRRQVCTRHGR